MSPFERAPRAPHRRGGSAPRPSRRRSSPGGLTCGLPAPRRTTLAAPASGPARGTPPPAARPLRARRRGPHDYLTRRRALDTDLDALSPGPAPNLDEARRVLDDFTRFWQQEQAYELRQQLLAHLFGRVWIDDKRIVAVRRKPAFASFFGGPQKHQRRLYRRRWVLSGSGSDGT